MKHLTRLSEDWPMYYKLAMLAYNSYATPNLDHLSPFEVAIGRKSYFGPRTLNINLPYLSQELMFRLKKS